MTKDFRWDPCLNVFFSSSIWRMHYYFRRQTTN